MIDPVVAAVALGMAGLVCGSFLATLVIRWPQQVSVARGCSRCDGCGVTLTAVELIPVVSAVMQRGRCRRCGGRIDPRHVMIEGACAAIGVLTALVVPGPAAIAGAMFGWLLTAIAALDVAELWIPDALNLTLLLTAVAAAVCGVPPAPADRLIGGAAGFAGLWLVAAAYRLLRRRDGLGGGDVKLFGVIGAWLGWAMLPAVLFLAAATGCAIAGLAMLRGRALSRDDAVPFGALLAAAAYPACLFLLGRGG